MVQESAVVPRGMTIDECDYLNIYVNSVTLRFQKWDHFKVRHLFWDIYEYSNIFRVNIFNNYLT
jgi:hypothetical protein